MVELGIFGCSRGGGLEKLHNYLMRYVGHVTMVKWEINFVRSDLERMCEVP